MKVTTTPSRFFALALLLSASTATAANSIYRDGIRADHEFGTVSGGINRPVGGGGGTGIPGNNNMPVDSQPFRNDRIGGQLVVQTRKVLIEFKGYSGRLPSSSDLEQAASLFADSYNRADNCLVSPVLRRIDESKMIPSHHIDNAATSPFAPSSSSFSSNDRFTILVEAKFHSSAPVCLFDTCGLRYLERGQAEPIHHHHHHQYNNNIRGSPYAIEGPSVALPPELSICNPPSIIGVLANYNRAIQQGNFPDIAQVAMIQELELSYGASSGGGNDDGSGGDGDDVSPANVCDADEERRTISHQVEILYTGSKQATEAEVHEFQRVAVETYNQLNQGNNQLCDEHFHVAEFAEIVPVIPIEDHGDAAIVQVGKIVNDIPINSSPCQFDSVDRSGDDGLRKQRSLAVSEGALWDCIPINSVNNNHGNDSSDDIDIWWAIHLIIIGNCVGCPDDSVFADDTSNNTNRKRNRALRVGGGYDPMRSANASPSKFGYDPTAPTRTSFPNTDPSISSPLNPSNTIIRNPDIAIPTEPLYPIDSLDCMCAAEATHRLPTKAEFLSALSFEIQTNPNHEINFIQSIGKVHNDLL